MRNKKGFTLIELLAVIIILGILMIIAIPAVTEYISSSRKSAYITTASRYIDGVRNKINAAEIPVYDKETTYYIPGSCVSMEKGGKSPYGDWKEYYVVVTYDGTGYDYYWTSRDETNTGIYLTYQDLLDVDRIENNVTSISTNIGVGDREKILLLKDSCSIFDSATGTIIGYKCGVYEFNTDTYQMLNVDECASYFSKFERFDENDARLYCTDDPSFDSSLKNDILSRHYSSFFVKQLIDDNIIKIDVSSSPVKDIVIPEKINGVTVTKIGDYAFAYSNLYTIEIPKTVTYIGEGTLSGNELLYNIVNKAEKSFDWGNILSSSYHTAPENNFDVGDYVGYNRYNVLDSLKKVTSEPINKIDFDRMFSFNFIHNFNFPDSVILKDLMGYEIYYNDLYDSDDWFKFSVGSTIEPKNCNPILIKILNDNEVIFVGVLVYDSICES